MKQFNVRSIHVITEGEHRGKIVAFARDGLYQYVPPFSPEYHTDPDTWPNVTKRGIQLFRDYWKYVCDHRHRNHGTYYLAYLDAPRLLIKGNEF